jgi:hypothetical protein
VLTSIQPKNGRVAGRTVREQVSVDAQRPRTSPNMVYADADLPPRGGFPFIPSRRPKLCRIIKFIFVVPRSVLVRWPFGYHASSNNSAMAEPDVGGITNLYLCSKSRRCPIDIPNPSVEPKILIQSIKGGQIRFPRDSCPFFQGISGPKPCIHDRLTNGSPVFRSQNQYKRDHLRIAATAASQATICSAPDTAARSSGRFPALLTRTTAARVFCV